MEMTKIIERLSLENEFVHGEPATDELIDEIERTLNVVFPDQYKNFIKHLGYARWAEGEIFGVTEDEYYDVVKNTIKARSQKIPKEFQKVPIDAVVINKYGGGGYYLLFCKDSKRPGQVILVLSETYYEEDECWDSFETFLIDMYLSD